MFFRPRPGQKIIDTMGSDENRDTAKLQAAPIHNEGENCKKRWSTSPEMGLTNHIICTCMSEVAIDASYNQLQRAKTSRSIIYRILQLLCS